ncbi:hypothetical protein ACNOYE_34570 [Nannocystaceae bacterium ST9]
MVFVRAITLSEFAGVEIGYRRALSRHFSFGVGLEYAYPDAGYGQIQAIGHQAELTAWIARPWIGPYFSASFVVGHNFLFSVPELRLLALGGGADFGWSWDLPFHINLGVSVGLRRMVPVERSGPLCSLRRECVYLLDEFQPHFGLSFGYRF